MGVCGPTRAAAAAMPLAGKPGSWSSQSRVDDVTRVLPKTLKTDNQPSRIYWTNQAGGKSAGSIVEGEASWASGARPLEPMVQERRKRSRQPRFKDSKVGFSGFSWMPGGAEAASGEGRRAGGDSLPIPGPHERVARLTLYAL